MLCAQFKTTIMQTFLPYPSFTGSAAALDNKRVVKQIVEVKQILAACENPKAAWGSHPIVRMWRGYEVRLAYYGFTCAEEYKTRFSRSHSLDALFLNRVYRAKLDHAQPWYGVPQFHQSHRLALYYKDPVFYGPKFNFTHAPLPPNYLWWCPDAKCFYQGQKSKNNVTWHPEIK